MSRTRWHLDKNQLQGINLEHKRVKIVGTQARNLK